VDHIVSELDHAFRTIEKPIGFEDVSPTTTLLNIGPTRVIPAKKRAQGLQDVRRGSFSSVEVK